MIRLAATAITALLLTGCAGMDRVRIANEVQTVKVPLLYCPAPPEFVRPDLQVLAPGIETVSDGLLVKAYASSIIELQGYIADLEAILKTYDVTSEAYKELRKKFNDEWTQELDITGQPE